MKNLVKKIAYIAGAAVMAAGIFSLSCKVNKGSANVAFAETPAAQIPQDSLAVTQALQDSFRSITSQVLPAVVEVDVKETTKVKTFSPFKDLPFFFGIPRDEEEGDGTKELEQSALGSGVIVRRTGNTVYVLTNNHVVGNATSIKIKLNDEREFEGKLVGKDERMDIALVSFESSDKSIAIAKLGDSNTIHQGDIVLALGSPLGYFASVTQGIVSATGNLPARAWGNITTGLELIRKIEGKEAYGFTMPLVLDKYGNKFGKSAGNALWLDLNKTSSYELYQYLVNVDDSMVVDYLKIFTFLSRDQIEELEAKNKEKPELREAHKALAREIITDLHGAAEFEKAVNISNSLFSGNVKSLSLKDIEIGFKDVPTATISEGEKLIDVLVNNKIASSKREAREFLAAGSITLNGEKFMDENMPVTRQLAIEGKVIVLRRGKKKNYIVKFG